MKQKAPIDDKRIKQRVLNVLRESGPLTFEALLFESGLHELEALRALFSLVTKGWVIIENGSLPIVDSTILNLNYMR